MSRRIKPLPVLRDDQLRASGPADHAALSASAGTGKTHVLTARVLRLLLSGVDPASILCLTFTKAGAAEMADRIHARLAHWVRLDTPKLSKELFALGEQNDEETLQKARTLFARVLDAAGGGLRILTIHAFAQSLLAAFPAEAGLVPGFRPLEGREEGQLARQTLADLLVAAESQGDLSLIRDVQALSHRLGENGAEAFLMQCARAPEAMAMLGAREGIEARLRRVFGLPAGNIEQAIEAACCDDLFDLAGLRRIAAHNRAWSAAAGQDNAAICEQWLAAASAERARLLDQLHLVWAKKDGGMRSFGRGKAPAQEDYASLATAAFECCARLLAMRRLAALVELFAGGLRAGQSFAAAYAAAKRTHGVVDFDDLIRWTEQLLITPGMGEWVRFKLDQTTDHILVDEAQDTNQRQWNIVRALTEEYFAGEGATGRRRTIFTVGDFKQAIFGFQGTDPRQFEQARSEFQVAARALRAAAEEIGIGEDSLPPRFLDLSMDLSFRSSPEILLLVDRLIADIGHDALGLPWPPNPHASHHQGRPGSVTLWQAYSEAEDLDEDAGEEGWISNSTRRYATQLANQIRDWIGNPFHLKSKGRGLRPEDILILVRRRGDLAALIVARLHAAGVPVAGVDRLLLSAPLAVQDLLAAARFALQPLDDLNLASLLVSPLFGWSQDELFELAFGREDPLWVTLRGRAGAGGRIDEALDGLHSLLAMADYTTPHRFFETILSGPLDGRRKLLLRLGSEARDPIEELLAGAIEFETGQSPSLQRFLDWFARGDVEIVRDPSAPLDAVRVMTVHGSKGLQSPIVILADACVDPARARASFTEIRLDGEGDPIPLFRPRKDELAEPLKSQVETQDRRDREEHWRLLYVALTRAEERLYVGGSLGAADRNGPPEASWYGAVEKSLAAIGGEWREDPRWGRSLRFGQDESSAAAAAPRPSPEIALPDWIRRPAPVETRPPRPLAPSALGEDDTPYPPPTPALRQAAERGKLLHQLFERLPGVDPADRAALADAWLERSAGLADPGLRQALVADACSIISDPVHAELFGPDSFAEAPIAAVTPDGSVVTGTIDRLMVGDDQVRVVDFKTGRSVPRSADEIPVPHLRQMSAYVAALEVIFPGRRVEASLLYTSGPALHALPAGLIDRFRPRPPAPLADG